MIGKPNSNACTPELIRYLTARNPSLVVFIGENDEPDQMGVVAGIKGPMGQRDRVVAVGLRAVFVLPPNGKDLREWKNKYGATASMLRAMVRNAKG